MESAIGHAAIDFESIDTSRYEQIGGQLVERSMPKARHAAVQGNIVEILGPKARATGLRAYPELSVDREDSPDSDWMTPNVVVAQPDFACTKRNNALPPLLLAIEVLSPEQNHPGNDPQGTAVYGLGRAARVAYRTSEAVCPRFFQQRRRSASAHLGLAWI